MHSAHPAPARISAFFYWLRCRSGAADEAVPQTAARGAQTLEDILARQRGEDVTNSSQIVLPEAATGAACEDQLGTLGGASDPDCGVRCALDTADITASNYGPGRHDSGAGSAACGG